MQIEEDKKFMKMALEEAQKALEANEVPVGCVVVHFHNSGQPEIVAHSHNMTNTLSDPLAHAEYLCIRRFVDEGLFNENNPNGLIGSNLTFYITLEPCAMCVEVLERINAQVVFGYYNEIFGTKKILNKEYGRCMWDKRGIEMLVEFYSTPNSNHPKNNS